MFSNKHIEKAKTVPHIRNVNMDPTLSGTIFHFFDGQGPKKIGSAPDSDIILKAICVNQNHAIINNNAGIFTIERANNSKTLLNGKPVVVPTELSHMDRILFGSSQYYVFIDPSKASSKDPKVSFETMQDEIAGASGLISKDNSNMTQEEIQCQTELIDLIPHIEEANAVSIALDKKVIFSALPVSADARGSYDGKFKVFVSVKNFSLGLEWIWTKEKFMDRKSDIIEIYNDFMDDGIINQEKFKVLFDDFLSFIIFLRYRITIHSMNHQIHLL